MNIDVISLIVPVFNEEDTIQTFYEAVRSYEGLNEYRIELVFINDGSRDGSLEILRSLADFDDFVVVIDLSRNFGKEAAMLAGLSHATGSAVIPMDVDLQDPIEVVPLLIEKWKEGFDVVLAKRADRSSDGFLKRFTAQSFYKVHNAIAPVKIARNVGDFRLMDRRVVEVVKQMPERQLFMKGLLSWVGFKTTVVEYSRAPRSAGSSKFNGLKLWNFALEGITSFSTVPLRVWTYIGSAVAAFALMAAACIVVDKLIFGNPVRGYPSLIISMLFLGGVQLIGIGVLGEYIGRIYMEVKGRPQFVIRDILRSDGNSAH